MSSPIWHPFTQHALTPDFPLIETGEGAWLTEKSGKRILDAISSWWVITHGHRHLKIMAAVEAQSKKIDQVIFANFTHQPAEDVARGLVEIAPNGLTRVFFSDSGSTAVEVGLKMALGYWQAQPQPRHRIIALEHAYHGDTIGTMAVGERGLFNAPYAPLLYEVDRLPFPAGDGKDTLAALERLAPDAAALIVEPLLLGAGGMLTYPPEILAAMKKICERHGVLLIADEVLTGFGRTGRLFACEQAGVTPDILCLAKGLTGGRCRWRRRFQRKPSSRRIIRPTAPARFFIPVPSPPIPSPVPQRRPIWKSGKRNRCWIASRLWRRPKASAWTALKTTPAFPAFAAAAPSRRWI